MEKLPLGSLPGAGLLPGPDQVVTAASNVAHKLFYGGVADLRPMPRTLIDDGQLREVYHYRPAPDVPATGDPILLVTPLAAPSLCYDLRRDCSLVQRLVDGGRPTYLVEYGEVTFGDRTLGMEHWIDDAVPTAIRAVSEHAGGRPVHVVGWSLGGIFSLLTLADRRSGDLPVASLSVVGSPVDVSLVPLIAPFRPLLNLFDGRLKALGPIAPITRGYQLLGGAPKPLVRWAFQLTAVQKLVTKPLVLATHIDDGDYLAQIEAVDRFTANMIAYPGRTFGQLYHRFARGNQIASGRFELDDRTIDLSDIDVPVLVFAGANDTIAPVKAVRAIEPMLTGAPEVRFEIVPGGHLGMLTGRQARTTTWPALEEWFDQWSGDEAPAPIGTSRKRRHASAASRSLGK